MKQRENIRVFTDLTELSKSAADLFFHLAQDAILDRGRFTVALSGGNTPKTTYDQIAQSPQAAELPWEKVFFFWGDERMVPPSDPQSNFKLAEDHLLKHFPIPSQNIYRVRTERGDATQVARDYGLSLHHFFGSEPILDLSLQGVGEDGHTASLFKDSLVMPSQNPWVLACWVKHLHAYRVSLTPGLLRRARNLVFLVSGLDKAEVMKRVLEPTAEDTAKGLPARDLRFKAKDVTWLLDQDSASMLNLAPSTQAA